MKNKIYFRTNLDSIHLPEYELDIFPPTGARVLCQAGSKAVNLEVYGATLIDGKWAIELHIPKSLGLSLRDWYKQYAGISI